jgi:hypothetical protein
MQDEVIQSKFKVHTEEHDRMMRQVVAHINARDARIMAERASERLLRVAKVLKVWRA